MQPEQHEAIICTIVDGQALITRPLSSTRAHTQFQADNHNQPLLQYPASAYCPQRVRAVHRSIFGTHAGHFDIGTQTAPEPRPKSRPLADP